MDGEYITIWFLYNNLVLYFVNYKEQQIVVLTILMSLSENIMATPILYQMFEFFHISLRMDGSRSCCSGYDPEGLSLSALAMDSFSIHAELAIHVFAESLEGLVDTLGVDLPCANGE